MDYEQQPLVQLPPHSVPCPRSFSTHTLHVAKPEKRGTKSSANTPLLRAKSHPGQCIIDPEGGEEGMFKPHGPAALIEPPRAVKVSIFPEVHAPSPASCFPGSRYSRVEKQQKVKCWVVLCQFSWQCPSSAVRLLTHALGYSFSQLKGYQGFSKAQKLIYQTLDLEFPHFGGKK